MKLDKYVYLIKYSFENFQKYNEEYFNKKGINAKIFLLLNNDLLVKGGSKNNITDNVSLTIPYRYFDELINYISKIKESQPDNKIEDSNEKQPDYEDKNKKNIFMEGIEKIQIMTNYIGEKLKVNEKEIKKEQPPTQKNDLFEKINFDDLTTINPISIKPNVELEKKNVGEIREELTKEQKKILFEEDNGEDKKFLKIESNKPIIELEALKKKDKEEEEEEEEEQNNKILEENILENTREYKLMNK